MIDSRTRKSVDVAREGDHCLQITQGSYGNHVMLLPRKDASRDLTSVISSSCHSHLSLTSFSEKKSRHAYRRLACIFVGFLVHVHEPTTRCVRLFPVCNHRSRLMESKRARNRLVRLRMRITRMRCCRAERCFARGASGRRTSYQLPRSTRTRCLLHVPRPVRDTGRAPGRFR